MENQKKEKACGCIIIDNNKVLLVQQKKGFWGFPKGHMEYGETEIETAIREVKEETNIDVVIPDIKKRYTQEYMLDTGVQKEVVFFLAKSKTNKIKKQEKEISEVKWLDFDEAMQTITYDNTREILKKALKDIEIEKNK